MESVQINDQVDSFPKLGVQHLLLRFLVIWALDLGSFGMQGTKNSFQRFQIINE